MKYKLMIMSPISPPFANFRRVNENEAYIRKLVPIEDSRDMAKVFGNPKFYSAVVAYMKSHPELRKANIKYPMMVIRDFFFAKSYLINHRLRDLKKGGTQV